MVKARANHEDNYQLSSFSPRWFNVHKIEVSKKEFEEERERLQKPYFDHLAKLQQQKKERDRNAKKI